MAMEKNIFETASHVLGKKKPGLKLKKRRPQLNAEDVLTKKPKK